MAERILRSKTAFSLGMTGRKRPRIHTEKHLAFIRTLPCIITGRTDGIEAAHVRYPDPRFGKPDAGLGKKPDDRWTVPLHWQAHAAQHAGNERRFWEMQGIDPVLVACALWGASGDAEACSVILGVARPPWVIFMETKPQGA